MGKKKAGHNVGGCRKGHLSKKSWFELIKT